MSRWTGQVGRSGRRERGARLPAALTAAILILGSASGGLAWGAEPAEDFLKGLRERGYHELALDYLTQMETSRLASAEFRERIPYHRGVTLIAQARETADIDQRKVLFEEASRELEQFVAAHPDSPSSADALLELANVLVDQAKQLLLQAGQIPDEPTFAEQREKLQEQARSLIDEAQPNFDKAEQFYATALDALPKTLDPKTQGKQIEDRQEFRGRLAQVSVLAAQAELEAASTFPKGGDEFVKRHTEAAKKLAELHEKYTNRVIGLYAQL